jgi:TRAP-type mannitol/chloroaromatic compound transport system permease small subunit
VEAASNEPTKIVETAKPPRTLPNKSPIASNSCSASLVAFEIGETSGDPGCLNYRFIIKSFIPLSFILVIITLTQKCLKRF